MERYERIPDVIIDSDKKDIYIVLYKVNPLKLQRNNLRRKIKK